MYDADDDDDEGDDEDDEHDDGKGLEGRRRSSIVITDGAGDRESSWFARIVNARSLDRVGPTPRLISSNGLMGSERKFLPVFYGLSKMLIVVFWGLSSRLNHAFLPLQVLEFTKLSPEMEWQ